MFIANFLITNFSEFFYCDCCPLFLFSVTGLDVLRTDRTLEFYEKPSNLAKLWAILAVYSWLDPEVGYCQGDQFSLLAITLEGSRDTINKEILMWVWNIFIKSPIIKERVTANTSTNYTPLKSRK